MIHPVHQLLLECLLCVGACSGHGYSREQNKPSSCPQGLFSSWGVGGRRGRSGEQTNVACLVVIRAMEKNRAVRRIMGVYVVGVGGGEAGRGRWRVLLFYMGCFILITKL